jgi:hypothetical protein
MDIGIWWTLCPASSCGFHLLTSRYETTAIAPNLYRIRNSKYPWNSRIILEISRQPPAADAIVQLTLFVWRNLNTPGSYVRNTHKEIENATQCASTILSWKIPKSFQTSTASVAAFPYW